MKPIRPQGRPRTALRTCFVLALLLLLTACSSSSTQSTQSTPTSTTPTSSSSSNSGQLVPFNLGIPQAALNSPVVGNVSNDTKMHVLVTFKPNDALLKQLEGTPKSSK